MFLKKVNRLIAIGMLVLITGCANQQNRPVSVSGEKTENSAFGRAVSIYQQAETLGAEDAAPKSYKKARQALDAARVIIKQDPENKEGIEESVKTFTFEAEHLLHITNEVNELRSVQYRAMENVVLSAEYRLLAISDALNQRDPRRQPLYEQAVTIANAAKQVVSSSSENPNIKRHMNVNELDKAHTRIRQLELQLKSSQDKKTDLMRDLKTLQKRIDYLERLVLELNGKITHQEDIIKELKGKLNKPKPPVE